MANSLKPFDRLKIAMPTIIYQTILLLLLPETRFISTLKTEMQVKKIEKFFCDDALLEKNCKISSKKLFTSESGNILQECEYAELSSKSSESVQAPMPECYKFEYGGHSMFNFRLIERNLLKTNPTKYLTSTDFYFFQERNLTQKISVNRDCTHPGESCASVSHYFYDPASALNKIISRSQHPTFVGVQTCQVTYADGQIKNILCKHDNEKIVSVRQEVTYEKSTQTASIHEYYLYQNGTKQLARILRVSMDPTQRITKVKTSWHKKSDYYPFLDVYQY